jgi:hypothetical protein
MHNSPIAPRLHGNLLPVRGQALCLAHNTRDINRLLISSATNVVVGVAHSDITALSTRQLECFIIHESSDRYHAQRSFWNEKDPSVLVSLSRISEQFPPSRHCRYRDAVHAAGIAVQRNLTGPATTGSYITSKRLHRTIPARIDAARIDHSSVNPLHLCHRRYSTAALEDSGRVRDPAPDHFS